MSGHTPGPWRWELNESSKSLRLVGGRKQFDLTIIEPIRWGMDRATLFVRDTALDGMNLLHKLHERRDWIAPFPGLEHHAKWNVGVNHPDMRLIEAAPDLLEALLLMVAIHDEPAYFDGKYGRALDEAIDKQQQKIDARLLKARAAIAKAKVPMMSKHTLVYGVDKEK